MFATTSNFADRSEKDKNYGVVIGIVTANADPTHAYRVKVRLPHLPGGGESDETQDSTAWARISTGLAGEFIDQDDKFGPRGSYFMPEIGDEVLVVFAFGDMSMPIVIGRLWSDVAPQTSGGGGSGDDGKPNHPVYAHTQKKGGLADGIDAKPEGHLGEIYKVTEHREKKNDIAGARTRSGHLLMLNDNLDKPGGTHKGGILLRSSTGHRIELLDHEDQGVALADSKGNYVKLHAGSGSPKGTIEIKTKGDIHLESTEGNIILKAKKNIETTSEGDTKMTSQKTYQVQATGEMKLNTNASGTVSASSSLKLTGNPININ